MIEAGTTSAYVLSAYGISALVLSAAAAWVFLDARARRRELKALEQGGARRRSAAAR